MTDPARFRNAPAIRSPRGLDITCRQWTTEAAMRMLMNNLDDEVAERPGELVVYGGIGRAARDWKSYETIVSVLKRLDEEHTLLVQSGKPVGVFRTHADAPRVLIANSNLVPRWASWEHFNELDRKGLMMYGQMTAGSWIYIGSQGIVQGTYETFAEAGRQHFGGSLAGRWILTAGLGGMGGAQPLAGVFAGACVLAVECQPSSIEKRLETRYLDHRADDLDTALAMIRKACDEKRAISVGLLGNAAEVFPELVRRGVVPDIVTDQTSAATSQSRERFRLRSSGSTRRRTSSRSSGPKVRPSPRHVPRAASITCPMERKPRSIRSIEPVRTCGSSPNRRSVSVAVRRPPRGLRTSWARAADRRPSVASFSRSASSAVSRSRSSSAATIAL